MNKKLMIHGGEIIMVKYDDEILESRYPEILRFLGFMEIHGTSQFIFFPWIYG